MFVYVTKIIQTRTHLVELVVSNVKKCEGVAEIVFHPEISESSIKWLLILEYKILSVTRNNAEIANSTFLSQLRLYGCGNNTKASELFDECSPTKNWN